VHCCYIKDKAPADAGAYTINQCRYQTLPPPRSVGQGGAVATGTAAVVAAPVAPAVAPAAAPAAAVVAPLVPPLGCGACVACALCACDLCGRIRLSGCFVNFSAQYLKRLKLRTSGVRSFTEAVRHRFRCLTRR